MRGSRSWVLNKVSGFNEDRCTVNDIGFNCVAAPVLVNIVWRTKIHRSCRFREVPVTLIITLLWIKRFSVSEKIRNAHICS